jgi:hypothetical protein
MIYNIIEKSISVALEVLSVQRIPRYDGEVLVAAHYPDLAHQAARIYLAPLSFALRIGSLLIQPTRNGELRSVLAGGQGRIQ